MDLHKKQRHLDERQPSMQSKHKYLTVEIQVVESHTKVKQMPSSLSLMSNIATKEAFALSLNNTPADS